MFPICAYKNRNRQQLPYNERTIIMYERWMEHAKCKDLPREMFFPTDGGGVVAAQKICSTCPVAAACLEYALGQGISDQFGVWGGCSERQRRRILKERAQDILQAPMADLPELIGAASDELIAYPSGLELEQWESQQKEVLIG